MSLRPSYIELERDEVKFIGELGWLAAAALTTVVLIAM